jgi:hypothetical protein
MKFELNEMIIKLPRWQQEKSPIVYSININ